MPYVNGKWETEDDTVEKRLTGLLAKDNDYMKTAETAGVQAANRRGLANSSMAVGAVENERIKAALPVATTDATGLLQKNLSRQGFEQSDVLQGKQIASTEGIAARDIASREGIAGADRSSRESLTREGYALQNTIAGADRTSRETIAREGNTTTTNIANADRTSRETMNRENNANQRTISDNTIRAGERSDTARLVDSAGTRRSTTVNQAMNNPDIPADVRNKIIEDANSQFNADVQFVEQIYNVDLDYPTPAAAASAPAAATAQAYDPAQDREFAI